MAVEVSGWSLPRTTLWVSKTLFCNFSASPHLSLFQTEIARLLMAPKVSGCSSPSTFSDNATILTSHSSHISQIPTLKNPSARWSIDSNISGCSSPSKRLGIVVDPSILYQRTTSKLKHDEDCDGSIVLAVRGHSGDTMIKFKGRVRGPGFVIWACDKGSKARQGNTRMEARFLTKDSTHDSACNKDEGRRLKDEEDDRIKEGSKERRLELDECHIKCYNIKHWMEITRHRGGGPFLYPRPFIQLGRHWPTLLRNFAEKVEDQVEDDMGIVKKDSYWVF
ncbi:hypothetical protein FPQ18DRAFT_311047 [Pyronema domesticum]|nr:hypothetical protein FPQ18DRAFT_311047 [Pyronema domesticum]